MDQIIKLFMTKVSNLCHMDEELFREIEEKTEELSILLAEVKAERTSCWDLMENAIAFLKEILVFKESSFILAAYQKIYSVSGLIGETYNDSVHGLQNLNRCMFIRERKIKHEGRRNDSTEIVIAFDSEYEWEAWKSAAIDLSNAGYKVYVIINSNIMDKDIINENLVIYYIGNRIDMPILFNIAFYITQTENYGLFIGQVPLGKYIEQISEILESDESIAYINVMSSPDFSNKLFMKFKSGKLSGIYNRKAVEIIGTLDECFLSEEYLTEDYYLRAEKFGFRYGFFSIPLTVKSESPMHKMSVDRDFEMFLRKYGRKKMHVLNIELITHLFAEIQSIEPEKVSFYEICDKRTTDILVELIKMYCSKTSVEIDSDIQVNNKRQNDCIIFMTPIGKLRSFEEDLLKIINETGVSSIVFYDENYLSGSHLDMVLSDKVEDSGSSVVYTIRHRKNLRNLIEAFGYTSTLTRISEKTPDKIRKNLSELFINSRDAINKNLDTRYYVYTFTKKERKA